MKRLRRWWYRLQDKLDRDTIQALNHALDENDREWDRLFERLLEAEQERKERSARRRPV